jgi:hypothetical protein
MRGICRSGRPPLSVVEHVPRWFDLPSLVELVVAPMVGLVEPNALRIRFEVTASTVGPKPATPRPWVHTRRRRCGKPLGGVRAEAAIARWAASVIVPGRTSSSTPAPPRAPLPTNCAASKKLSVTTPGNYSIQEQAESEASRWTAWAVGCGP